MGFGILSVVYGISIFVFLPIALVNVQIGVMLTIFFLILMGMVYGLSMLASNILPALETVLVKILLCWERMSMKKLIEKNLITHRRSNK